ncbi:MAG: MmgE/PrpD family protein [Burkholderiales bacterium]
MDKTTDTLASYVTSLAYSDLSPVAIRITKKLIIDAFGCAIGGYRGQPSVIARKIAAQAAGTPPARVLGSDIRSSMDLATFANSVMIRYLDFNDTYTSIGEGHPSDAIPAVLAVADAYQASGKDVILAMAAAYEVYMALCDVVSLRDKGWDHGYFVVFAAAVGAGKILGLNKEQMGNAIALASGPNVPTRQTRSGELSMWKGCACAASARGGVFAALLAKAGMTGPTAAFEGRHGVWDQVTRPFTLPPLGDHGKGFGVERCGIKFFPTEYHSQVPLSLALKLRKKFRMEDLDHVMVDMYDLAYSEIGSEPEKWDPKTRETADHSLPYMLAAVLRDGVVSIDMFTEERIQDRSLRVLMNQIRTRSNPEFTREFPLKMNSRIEIVTRSGERHVEHACYPKGHEHDPMTDAEVEEKFRQLCRGFIDAAQGQKIMDAVWDLDRATDIGAVLDLVKVPD